VFPPLIFVNWALVVQKQVPSFPSSLVPHPGFNPRPLDGRAARLQFVPWLLWQTSDFFFPGICFGGWTNVEDPVAARRPP